MSKFGGDRTGLTQEVAEAVARELVVPLREVIEMNSRLNRGRFIERARGR